VIAGIGHFYRQFGYEYAVPMGGGRTLRADQIPDLKEGEVSPYHLRLARAQDLPLLQRYYAELVQGLCVASVIPDDIWLYQDSQPEDSEDCKVTYLVERKGEPVGYVRFMRNEDQHMHKGVKIVEAFVPHQDACLEVLRFAKRVALEERQEHVVRVEMAIDVPLNQAAAVFGGERQRPYGWQVRVMDAVRFLTAIGPALEKRLAESPLAGLTRELTFGLHREGLVLRFEKGCLRAVERLPETVRCDVTCPPFAVLMLWLGHRSLDETLGWYPDAWRRDAEAERLVNILFPKRPSWVASLF
jgi:hypothetical protein